MFEAAAVAFFCLYLILMAFRIPQMTTVYLRQNADNADEPGCRHYRRGGPRRDVCFVSLFEALNASGKTQAIELILLFASVISGWMTIHTMAAIHYAHLYWRPDVTMRTVRAPMAGWNFRRSPGLRPGLSLFCLRDRHDGSDVDVAITSTPMRQLNLLHSVGSFFFNTVLVAAVVNAAVTLAG